MVPDDVLVQLDGELEDDVVYCSQCELCNKTMESKKQKKDNVSNVRNVSSGEGRGASDNRSEISSEKGDKATTTTTTVTSESRKTTRVALDCDAIVSVPQCDDATKSVTNGKNLSTQRSKKKKKGRQLLYSNGASSDVKESSSQAGDKGSNDDEVIRFRFLLNVSISGQIPFISGHMFQFRVRFYSFRVICSSRLFLFQVKYFYFWSNCFRFRLKPFRKKIFL